MAPRLKRPQVVCECPFGFPPGAHLVGRTTRDNHMVRWNLERARQPPPPPSPEAPNSPVPLELPPMPLEERLEIDYEADSEQDHMPRSRNGSSSPGNMSSADNTPRPKRRRQARDATPSQSPSLSDAPPSSPPEMDPEPSLELPGLIRDNPSVSPSPEPRGMQVSRQSRICWCSLIGSRVRTSCRAASRNQARHDSICLSCNHRSQQHNNHRWALCRRSTINQSDLLQTFSRIGHSLRHHRKRR